MEDEDSLILDSVDTKRPKFIYLVTLLSAIGGCLFGYDTGVISGAMILLAPHFTLNEAWQELIVSSTIAMAWIFSILAGFLTDRYGRKPVIILASFVFTVGAVMMGLSRERYLLLGGRLVVGIGIGLASMTVPMYIGEVAPLDIRGTLLTVNNCFITGGQLLASIVDGLFSNDKLNGWRYMLGLAGIPSLIQFFCFFFMPESPRWLVSKEQYEEAFNVLKKVGGSSSKAEQEFEAIKSSYIESTQDRGESSIIMQVLRHTALRRALLVGCALQMFQQIAGINTVMYYSATIIQMAGVRDSSKAIWLSASTSAVNFVCTFIGLFLVEKIGRRLLTLGSLTGVVVSLCVLGLGFQLTSIHSPSLDYHDQSASNSSCYKVNNCERCISYSKCGYCFQTLPTGHMNSTCLLVDKNHTDVSLGGACSTFTENTTWAYEWCPTSYSWLILLGLLLYLFFFAPGMGPMPWTINSEIYPLWARSTCYSIATSVNWLFNLLISMTFLTLTGAITKYGAFYLYAVLALSGWIFFFVMLPETKGKTLEEVESLFSHSVMEDATICGGQKSTQYIHIRGLTHSHSYDADSGEE